MEGPMSEVYDSIMRGLAEAEAHLKGEDVPGLAVHIPAEIDVAAIRQTTGLSQSKFADWIGVSKRTIENWEQGRRVPQGPARVLLAIIRKEPDVVQRMLAA